MTIEQLAAANDGKLPSYAWPGGYAVIYLDKQNSTLCPECANNSFADEDELPLFKPQACMILQAGEVEMCEQCGKEVR